MRCANRQELSIDLMRYVANVPYEVMEFLFLELMLDGRAEGFQYFSLGMAPLSGVEAHRFGSSGNQFSALMFRHGKHFYNFQGLRNYKDKFDPAWPPKYLAASRDIATARVLTLISGSWGETDSSLTNGFSPARD
ncbi:phosphatidylglycerol lysyltransferase domain-containing protein [Rhodopirellula sp. P2]|nr:phosphatidylglycerol lysyltransferase domain-containing protein [Rhodopirellula sp. P2]WDQ19547.1 phosphatidylglycerol lysyltransferase domain-containing protein [Rhodopirellula sp. P2]